MSVTKRTRPYALNLVTVQKYKSQEDKGKNNCSSSPAKLSSVLVPALAPAQTTGMNSRAFARAQLKSHFEHVFRRISALGLESCLLVHHLVLLMTAGSIIGVHFSQPAVLALPRQKDQRFLLLPPFIHLRHFHIPIATW